MDPQVWQNRKAVRKKLNLTEINTVVINSMSNTAFLGTDDDGLPIPAEKSEEDGQYHLSGDLQLAPPLRFKIYHENGRYHHIEYERGKNRAYGTSA